MTVPEPLSPSYAEAAVLTAYAPDAESGLFLRLARFPGRGEAWVWVDVFSGDHHYSLSETVPLTGFAGATDTSLPRAEFALTRPPVQFVREALAGAPLRCRLDAAVACNPGPDPTGGPGDVPVRIVAEFVAIHEPGTPREGRLEVFGDVQATVELPGRTFRLDGRGKWHEQLGERPAFARPFTYLHLQNERVSLLATSMPGIAWGFAVRDGERTPVTGASIAPRGVNRPFQVTMADGSTISGIAIRRRTSEVPVDGQLWKGSIVVASSTEGTLVGAMNDWQQPEG